MIKSHKITMEEKIILKDSVFEEIKNISEKLNIETYVVGGYVRDLILNIPSKDIDIVCLNDAVNLANKVAEYFNIKKITIYQNFGAAMIKYKDLEIEFITARKESYSKNSRKPSVNPGTLQDDQNRRDFTINSLAISLNDKSYGKLLDPFNGISDLKNKIIKTPLDPDKTFSDDPLRILRAIRFATRLGFNIEKNTYQSIKDNINRLDIVSIERITSEINKTLLADQPSRAILIYYKTGILKKILPELIKLDDKETINGFTHKNNFYHTLQVLDNIAIKTKNLWLRWAALLHDIAKPQTKRFDNKIGFSFHGHEELGSKMIPKIFKRLKLPLGINLKYVQKLVRLHLRPIALVNDFVTDSAIRRIIFEAGDELNDLILLCRADITSENPIKVKQYMKNFDIVEEKIKLIEKKDKIKNFQPIIDGKEIMKIFNLKPSKSIGILKNDLKEAILDGKIKNEHKQAYDFLVSLAKKYKYI